MQPTSEAELVDDLGVMACAGPHNRGRLTGTTDTDYFYFFCPEGSDRHILRILDYDIRKHGPVEYNPEAKPKQARDFVLAFKLYCPSCKFKGVVKLSNIGWQGGRLPAEHEL
jgi:hypothetical protein